MPEWVYLNGQMVEADQANISAFDAGFTHATGLFETFRAYAGKVFRLDDHLQRMNSSALALQIPAIADELNRHNISDSISDLLTANNLQDARLRLVATPGPIPRPGEEEPKIQPTLLLTAAPLQTHPPELYRHGMRACICPFRISPTDPQAGHKTLCYFPRLLAMRDAQQKKCHESLWFTTGNMLSEGSVCNVFIFHDGKLMTPPLDTPVLPGIVRKAVIELASTLNIAVKESPIDIEKLLSATEVFFTGSIMEIMPVTSIEKHVVGSGAPGSTCQLLMQKLKELITTECTG